MELYQWQKDCLNIWKENQYRGIIQVVTGGGKTLFALEAAKVLNQVLKDQLRIKIVVPTIPLVRGWSAAINRSLSDDFLDHRKAGIFTGERKDSPDHKVMIYTINSARYHISRHIYNDVKNGFSVLFIADECHHYSSSENRKIFDFLKEKDFQKEKYFCLGLSATPQSASNYHSVLVPALGKEIYRYSYEDALKAGTISKFNIFQIALSFSSEEMLEYERITTQLTILRIKLIKEYPFLKKLKLPDFFQTIKRIAAEEGEDSYASAYVMLTYQRLRLTYDASSRISCTVDLIQSFHPKERLLIFSEKISQAEALYTQLNALYPNETGIYHSKMQAETRKMVLENFKDGLLRIIVSCKALDEGIDVPDATIGIILSGTSVDRQRIQRLGRLIRKSEQKACADLYYLYIKESAEDSAYLSDHLASSNIFNLSYSSGDHFFRHDAYENKASELLASYRRKGISEEKEKELRQCINEGLTRSDWMLPANIIQKNINLSRKMHERNYWFCMRLLSESENPARDTYT